MDLESMPWEVHQWSRTCPGGLVHFYSNEGWQGNDEVFVWPGLVRCASMCMAMAAGAGSRGCGGGSMNGAFKT